MFSLRKLQAGFFDRAEVTAHIGAKAAGILSRAGSFVRQSAIGLIRTRKGPSAPGNPPHNHTGKLKHRIYFSYDRTTQTVVIGPDRLNQITAVRALGTGEAVGPNNLRKGIVPQILEYGGTVLVREILRGDGTWMRIPLSMRLSGTRRVPIWRATDEDRRKATGRVVVKSGKRGLTFLEMPREAQTQRLREARIAARPYMRPALVKGMADLRKKSGIVGVPVASAIGPSTPPTIGPSAGMAA